MSKNFSTPMFSGSKEHSTPEQSGAFCITSILLMFSKIPTDQQKNNQLKRFFLPLKLNRKLSPKYAVQISTAIVIRRENAQTKYKNYSCPNKI